MLREYLSNIADKFRTYLDTTEPINAQDFAGKVEDVAVRHNQLGFTNGYNLGLEEGTEQGKPLGKLELLQDSEYMNAKVSGTEIAVNDVSPIEHSVGCKVASKNLYKPEIRTSDSAVNYTDGVLFVPQYGGNTYVCDCVPLYIPQNTWLYYKHTLLLGKDRVVIRLFNSNGENISTDAKTNIECSPAWYLGTYAGYVIDNPADGFSFKVTSNVAYITFGYCGMNSDGGNKYGDLQLELGTTATAYTPYVAELGGIEVSRLGKNLFDIDTVLPSFINNYGDAGKWIKQSDGSYFKGNVGTGYGDIWFENTANYKGQIAISMASKHTITKVGESGLTLEVAYTDGTKKTAIYTPMLSETYSVKTFVTDANKTVFRITQSYNNGEGMYVKDVMIAYGSDTSYEPYIEPTTYQSTADGTVEGVTSISPNMTLLTNNNGVVINANYLRDIDTYIDNLKTNVALTGGE